jgi:hypothetical protein
MRLVIGFVFATALVTPALAFEGCGSQKVVASTQVSTPVAPVQTAEAPSTTQTK